MGPGARKFCSSEMKTVLPMEIKHRCFEFACSKVNITGCFVGTKSDNASSPAKRLTELVCCVRRHQRYRRGVLSLDAGACDAGGTVKGQLCDGRCRGGPGSGSLLLTKKTHTKPRHKSKRTARGSCFRSTVCHPLIISHHSGFLRQLSSFHCKPSPLLSFLSFFKR